MRRIVTWSSLAFEVAVWVLNGLSHTENSPMQAAGARRPLPTTASSRDEGFGRSRQHGGGGTAHAVVSTSGGLSGDLGQPPMCACPSATLGDRPEGDRRSLS